MGFRPTVSPALRTMEARIFAEARMGLAAEIAAKPARAASPRLAELPA
jgi:propionate CoA-transferase